MVGDRVPADVELEAVPADWGPSLTKYRYVYSGDRVILVDPGSQNRCSGAPHQSNRTHSAIDAGLQKKASTTMAQLAMPMS